MLRQGKGRKYAENIKGDREGQNAAVAAALTHDRPKSTSIKCFTKGNLSPADKANNTGDSVVLISYGIRNHSTVQATL
jgi:hypothetical protein